MCRHTTKEQNRTYSQNSGVTLGDGAPRLLAKRRPYMERARFARGKVTGRRGHSTNLVRILWLVDIIALDFIQLHLKVRQFNLRCALFISRGPQTAKLMYKRIYMIALDFKF